ETENAELVKETLSQTNTTPGSSIIAAIPSTMANFGQPRIHNPQIPGRETTVPPAVGLPAAATSRTSVNDAPTPAATCTPQIPARGPTLQAAENPLPEAANYKASVDATAVHTVTSKQRLQRHEKTLPPPLIALPSATTANAAPAHGVSGRGQLQE
ncbi:Protein of unknown function, partial [Gryllus bimaculatus]